MSWDILRQRWLDDLESHAYSPNTILMARDWTRRLADFLEAIGVHEPVDVTRTHLDAYRQRISWGPGLRGFLYSVHTVDKALTVARDFFRWATARGFLLVDPTLHWVLPRPTTPAKPVLTVSEIARMVETPNPDRPTGLRDRAILETFYSTAVRLGECRALDLPDLEWSLGTVRIRNGKGPKDRRVPLGPALSALLSRYLTESRPKLVKSPLEPALFLTRDGDRMSKIRYQKLIQETCTSAGVPRISAHDLRRACAVHLLEGGASLHDVQRLLGHERMQTTRSYTELCPESLSQVHFRTHPRARLSDFDPPEQPPV
jgi:integrase/recombinase XerD